MTNPRNGGLAARAPAPPILRRIRDVVAFVGPEIERSPHLRAVAIAAVAAVAARRRDRGIVAVATGLVAFESAQQGEATRRAVGNSADTVALTAWLPDHGMEFGGYAIDADLASVLRSHVRHGGHRSIVEFGAGLSTLTTALALEQLGGDGSIVSFEAGAAFGSEVTRMLERAGLSHRARVVHAPLGPRRIHGRDVDWHDPELVVAEAPAQVDLLFVDGPVSASSWSRWAALEVLWDRLAPGSVSLLDDSRRRREHQCAMRWANAHPELQMSWIDTVTGVWRAEVRHTPREAGSSRYLHALLRTVNPRPAGWGKWPVRRV